MILTWKLHRLNLKHTFSIAYGNYNFRDSIVVCLEGYGKKGFGEAVAIDYYKIDLQEFSKILHEVKSFIEIQKIAHPVEFHNCLKRLSLHPFLLSALDCSYWDLYGKLENKTIIELCEIPHMNVPQSSVTISVNDIDRQIRDIEESSWTKFKVKCKGLTKSNIERLIRLEKDIALDSNASFTNEDCIWLQENDASAKFSYLEQPRPVGNYKILNKTGFANWMADEDAQNLSSLEELYPYYRSINVKVMKCGGITPALNMIKAAKKMGYKVMIGCMTESSVGISAGCALAGFADYADLDGANLISNDFATGSYIENGQIHLSEKPGLGIEIK